MLRIVARDSAIAVTSPRRSPDIRVTPADSIATSVPVPIATPTSAEASAGASLTPSPTIATTVPSAWRAFTAAALPSGRTSATTRSMPTDARDRLGRAPVVAGEHGDRDAEAVQLGDGLDRPRLERVGDGDDARRPGRRSRRRPGSCRRRRGHRRRGAGRPVDAEGRQEAGRPTRTLRPPTDADTPPPATLEEVRRRRRARAAASRRLAHDRVGERVLRAALGGGDEGEDLVLGGRAVGADDVGDAGLALGERAGLVEDHGLDRAEPLERLGVAEQHAVLGALSGADHDRGGRGETERARAGDDQDGDRVEQRQVERGLRAEGEPDDERQRGQAEHRRARSSR